MKYLELKQKIKTNIFSWQDLKINGLKVYPYQLSRWVNQGYLIKLKNGFYLFADKKEETWQEYVAFSIYQPSYVSLEWALSIYGVIPEIVYNVTSVTSKATRQYENELGLFIYQHIKKDLFFGYDKIKKNNQVYLCADLEKALLDYLYLNNHKIKDIHDVKELRFNDSALKKINRTKLFKYLGYFPQRNNLKNIIKLILK